MRRDALDEKQRAVRHVHGVHGAIPSRLGSAAPESRDFSEISIPSTRESVVTYFCANRLASGDARREEESARLFYVACVPAAFLRRQRRGARHRAPGVHDESDSQIQEVFPHILDFAAVLDPVSLRDGDFLCGSRERKLQPTKRESGSMRRIPRAI